MNKIFLLLVSAILAIVFGFFGFVNQISNYKIPTKSAELGIVFTGGSGRITAGINSLKTGKIKHLFISGVHRSVPSTLIVKNKSKNITLDYKSKNTFDNAVESAKFIKQGNYKSIYLITGVYHMPRAIAEIKSRIDGVEIIPYPVQNEWIKTKKWYLYSGTLSMFIIEYAKTIAVLGRTIIN